MTSLGAFAMSCSRTHRVRPDGLSCSSVTICMFLLQETMAWAGSSSSKDTSRDI